MGYFKNAVQGFSWMTALQGSIRIVTFIRTVILARIFDPNQFGIFGIAALVLSLFEVVTETGIVVLLIQEKKDLSEYINEAWFISIIRGGIIALFILVSAPFIALFFHTGEVIPLLLLSSAIPLIRGFINPAIINFQKQLLFHKEFYFRAAIYCIDTIISVGLAFITKNIASLVWGLIISAAFEVMFSFFLVKPVPQLLFVKRKIVYLIQKGKWITVFNIFGYLSSQTDNAVVGKFLGTASLGLYQLAYKVAITPVTEISDLIAQVVFPVYSKIVGEKKRLWNAFLKTSLFLSLPIIILGTGIFLFPKEIILILLGRKWLEATTVLKILAIYGIIRGIFGSTATLFLSVGRNDLAAGMTMVRFTSLAVSIIPLVLAFGIVGAAYSALLSSLIEIPYIIYCLYLVFA